MQAVLSGCWGPASSRTLIDEKINVGDAPKDLQRLASTLLEVDQAAVEGASDAVGRASAQATETILDASTTSVPSTVCDPC